MKRYQCTACGRFCKAPAQGPYGHDYDPYCDDPCLQNAAEAAEERKAEYDPPSDYDNYTRAWLEKHNPGVNW